MHAKHPHCLKGSTHRFERNCWLRSSAGNTTTTMCMFRRSSSGQITNHLSPYCRSPWHQFSKDYSAYYCGFNNTTARYTTSLARRCCYLIPCQELIQRTMSDQPQNQRWSASTPLTSFLFQTTSSRNFREKRLGIQLYSFQRKQSWMASQVQRKNNQQPFTSTLKSEMSSQYIVV